MTFFSIPIPLLLNRRRFFDLKYAVVRVREVNVFYFSNGAKKKTDIHSETNNATSSGHAKSKINEYSEKNKKCHNRNELSVRLKRYS